MTNSLENKFYQSGEMLFIEINGTMFGINAIESVFPDFAIVSDMFNDNLKSYVHEHGMYSLTEDEFMSQVKYQYLSYHEFFGTKENFENAKSFCQNAVFSSFIDERGFTFTNPLYSSQRV